MSDVAPVTSSSETRPWHAVADRARVLAPTNNEVGFAAFLDRTRYALTGPFAAARMDTLARLSR